jgi:protease-4
MSRKRTIWVLAAVVAGVALLGAVAGALVFVARLGDGGGSWGGARYLQVTLNGALAEQPRSEFGGFFAGRQPSLHGVIEGLERASGDAEIHAVVLRIGSLSGTGWGKVQEIRDAVVRFQKSKKPVHAYLEDAGSKEYYLAAACSKIHAAPTAMLRVSGLAAQVTFFRKTLDKLGVEAQFEGFGKYKNAPNQYTESTFTPPHREQIEALVDELFTQLVQGIAAGRRLSEADVRRLIDEGPYDARRAVEVGLVDDVLYGEEIEDKVVEGGRRVALGPYVRGARGLGWGQPKIAVVTIVGEIVLGESAEDAFGGEYAGADTISRALHDARKRSDVKAVVLRIDSPGGVGTAADAIWREVGETVRVKPVIASMSDVAASGGYYVAMGAQAVFAEPGTITGSIGVYGGKLSLRGFYDKIGVTKEELTRGRFAGLFSDYRPWTEDERLKVRSLLGTFYEEFVRKAALGRGRSREEIESVAQGRVWAGSAARQHGLVDRTGGLRDALDLAKEKAGIPKGQEVTLLILPERKGFFESLLDRDSPAVRLAGLPAQVVATLRWAQTISGPHIAARLPFDLSIE